jgi:hypothetical protein
MAMEIFGFVIVRKDTFKLFEKYWYEHDRIIECHRWFSGWEDLDVIWDYLLGKNFAHVGDAREKYADKRKTDVYGDKK